MIKIGLVGCGKVADQHAVQIRRIPGATIVAVCDSEPLMAGQMADRFGVPGRFADVAEMLRSTKLDVIHVTTPPQSHYAIGKQCLAAGCNVYIEKPFTLDVAEAEELVALATSSGLRLTAGHNAQFTHAMVRMRELVRSGYLGGNPVHMESIYCYALGDESYAQALLGDHQHWVRKLPGSLLQNIISHGISKIAEFINDDDPRVIASGFTSRFLQKIGQGDIADEVRVIVRAADATTAYFTFSTQISPPLHQLRLYGPRNSLLVDDDQQVVLRIPNTEYKSYLRYSVPPIAYARQYVANFGGNLWKFLRGDFHLPFDAGLKTLVEQFYSSILHGTALPISYREIVLTTRIMDRIFAQIER